MTKVSWLPLGHVSHGYRRVFLLQDENPSPRILVLTPLPYEAVYHVQQESGGGQIADPALLWGLSIIKHGMQSHSLSFGDDGFLSMRPQLLQQYEFLPVEEYAQAVTKGEWVL